MRRFLTAGVVCAALCAAPAVALAGSAAGRITDPTVTLQVLPAVTVTEGSPNASVGVFVRILDWGGHATPTHLAGQIALRYTDGTAKAGEDYRPNGTQKPNGALEELKDLYLAEGSDSLWQTGAAILDDQVPEGKETFTIEIVNVKGLKVKNGKITVTILDDDGPAPKAALPEVWVSDDSRPEGDPGDRGIVTFAVHLSEASASEVAVDYRTVAVQSKRGAATSGDDFEPASGTLRFPPGKTIGFVNVEVGPDLEPEPDEDFTLELVRATGATVSRGANFKRGTGTAVGRILDDDGVPAASLVDPGPRLKEGNAGGTRFVFTVRLSHVFRRALTVGYRTFEGARSHDHAIAGVDFTALRGVLTFRPGETEQKIVVTVYGDREPEHDESFAVLLERGGASTADVPLHELANATILTDDGAPDDTAIRP